MSQYINSRVLHTIFASNLLVQAHTLNLPRSEYIIHRLENCAVIFINLFHNNICNAK